MIQIFRRQIEEIFVHARQELPRECCGLIGGRNGIAGSVYRLKNVAPNPLVEYEAAPVELFAAQRKMRQKGEQLLAIYHSHPTQAEPIPSATDIQRAFYPDAVYLIIGFNQNQLVLRCFRIYENERRWEQARFIVVE